MTKPTMDMPDQILAWPSFDGDGLAMTGAWAAHGRAAPEEHAVYVRKRQTVAGSSAILKHFTYAHLPPHLQAVSKPICELAHEIDATLPNGPEKSAGLRKLLEAKDCFVRAKLEQG